MKFFEDIVVGERTILGSYCFTAAAIKAFARDYDPQPFHLDEAAAESSSFGRLCASGWHTCGAWMRCFYECRTREDAERLARGEPVAQLGPSPGLQDLKWRKPVYAGDVVTFAQEVVGLRVLATRPGWGLMTADNSGVNQHHECVLSFRSTVLVERRSSNSVGRP